MQNDFIEKNTTKLLLKFTLPALAANLLQMVYTLGDMAVIGRFVGSAGLAAISNAGLLIFVTNGLVLGLSVGGTVVLAEAVGRKDKELTDRLTGNLFTLSVIFGLLITALILLLYPPLLRWMQVPDEAVGYAGDYLRVTAAGTLFVCGYEMIRAVMRGHGESTKPLVFVALAVVLNVGLDLLFVGWFRLGTVGAAAATIIAQAVAFLTAAIYLLKKRVLRFQLSFFKCQWQHVKRILKIGIPQALQTSSVNLIYLVIIAMLNPYGLVVAAAAGIGFKINSVIGLCGWAVGSAVSAITGHCMGEENPLRAKEVYRKSMFLNFLMTLFAVVLVQIFAASIVGFFDTSEAVIVEGVRYMRICVFLNVFFYTAMCVAAAYVTGRGRPGFSLFINLLDSVVLQLLFALTFRIAWGHLGIYAGLAYSSVIPAAIVMIYIAKLHRNDLKAFPGTAEKVDIEDEA